MSEFLEILSPNALEQLKQAEELVSKLATDIKTINSFKPSNSPSGSDKNIQGLNTAYKERGETFKNLAGLIDKVATSQNNLTARTKEAVLGEEKLNKAIKARFDAVEKEANSASSKKALQDREIALKKLNELTKEATT